MKIRIVIGGCRNYCNYFEFCKYVDACLLKLNAPDIVIISGHCSGVDSMAERYAAENKLKLEIYSANWQKYGRAAGPIRNKIMVENSDVIIAFWDGVSKGTKSLIDIATKYKKKVFIQYI